MLKKLIPLATYWVLLGALLYAEYTALYPLIADDSNLGRVFMGYVVMLAYIPPTGMLAYKIAIWLNQPASNETN